MEPIRNRLIFVLSWIYLLWERLTCAFWPVVTLMALVVALALVGLPSVLPAWLHACLLAAGAAFLIFAFRHGCSQLRAPTRRAAVQRLQHVNGLQHRPLEALSDQLADGLDSWESRALWQEYRHRLEGEIKDLSAGIPRPRLIRLDPMAWRVAASVLLVTGLAAAGTTAPERLVRGLIPQLAIFEVPPPPIIDAWLTPPTYTGVAPSFLSGASAEGKTLSDAPASSILSVRITGSEDAPRLVQARTERTTRRLDARSFGTDLELRKSDTVAVVVSEKTVVEWTIRVIPDAPPVAAFLSTPSEGRRNVLHIRYRASDDYGLTGVRAVVTRDRKTSDAERNEINLTLPRMGAKKAVSSSSRDLTAHPWAGLPVRIHLEATDAAGQIGRSADVQITMPEREFLHPVARKIVIERRKLMADPSQADLISEALRDTAREPERYNDDVTAFLALNLAARRIAMGPTQFDQEAVQQLLWDTALRIEDDSELSIAKRNLREAEKALQDALEKGARDREISRLMEEFESAVNQYFDELAKMMKPSELDEAHTMSQNDRVMALSRRDFKNLIDQIRKLARSGSKADAKLLLSQLKNLIENMQTGRMASMSPRGQESIKLLNRLQKLIRDQQKLLDKTFREAQRNGLLKPHSKGPRFRRPGDRSGNQRGRPSEGPSGRQLKSGQMLGDAQTQEALRRRLGDIMRQLGEMAKSIPRSMGRAERSMRRSSEFLGTGRPSEAVQPQTRALDQLNQGAKAATRELMKQLGQGLGQRPYETGQRQDPFGRTRNGNGDMNARDMGIDDRDELQRARGIRDELRRRSGQRQRPEIERDYINRLLRRF